MFFCMHQGCSAWGLWKVDIIIPVHIGKTESWGSQIPIQVHEDNT